MQDPALSVMVGEDEEEPVRMTEYDTAELEPEISKLRNQLRKADSGDDPQAKRDGSSTTKVKERGKRITMMRLRRNQQIRRKLRVTLRRGSDQWVILRIIRRRVQIETEKRKRRSLANL